MKEHLMPLTGHLAELRKRIIYTLLAFIVFLVISFIYVKDIYIWIIRDFEQPLTALGPSDILKAYFMISGVIASAFTIPIAAHQTWLFVKPALSEKERKITLTYIPALFLLFAAGLSFGYFIVYPIVLHFLLSLSNGQFETMFTAENYFNFILHLTLPFGFLFEMPLIVMFLTSLGIVNPMILSKMRRVSYFLLILVSIFITPPDFISDALVAVPLLILYEFSLSLSRIIYRKKTKTVKKIAS